MALTLGSVENQACLVSKLTYFSHTSVFHDCRHVEPHTLQHKCFPWLHACFLQILSLEEQDMSRLSNRFWSGNMWWLYLLSINQDQYWCWLSSRWPQKEDLFLLFLIFSHLCLLFCLHLCLANFFHMSKAFPNLHWISGLDQLHFFFEVIGFSAFWTCWELFLFYSLSFWLFLFCFSFFPLALLLVVLPWVLPLFFTKKAPFASLFILKDLYCLVACTIFTSSVKVILEKSFDTSKEEILILSLWEIY